MQRRLRAEFDPIATARTLSMKSLFSSFTAALPAGAARPGAQALTLRCATKTASRCPWSWSRQVPEPAARIDASDNGYPASGKLQQGASSDTRFTDAKGQAVLPDSARPFRLRLRKPGFKVADRGIARPGADRRR